MCYWAFSELCCLYAAELSIDLKQEKEVKYFKRDTKRKEECMDKSRARSNFKFGSTWM